jgi:hypothetical protein
MTHPDGRLPWRAQILVGLKSADPTALTAEEAVRHLLGFDDRLLELQRRVLHEVTCVPAAPDPAVALIDRLTAYLMGTLTLWNSNKHRCWVRLRPPEGPEEAWEVRMGGGRTADAFGRPSLEDGGHDHLLVWGRGGEPPPEDLAGAWKDWLLQSYSRGDLYTLRWRETEDSADRARWTEAVGPVAARGRGLLVNPHAQDSLRFSAGVPIPAWGGKTA